eukprot:4490818-Prymnesium_polylepis.1
MQFIVMMIRCRRPFSRRSQRSPLSRARTRSKPPRRSPRRPPVCATRSASPRWRSTSRVAAQPT